MKDTKDTLDNYEESESRIEYLKALSKIQRKKRERISEINSETTEYVKHLQKIYSQETKPKSRARKNELNTMIGMVLETGNSGTKVIREYAKNHGKDNQWCREIAKPKAGKLFEEVLSEYEEHPVIVAMKKRNKYSKRDILKNTVTGALKQLGKQVSAYKELLSSEDKIEQLNAQLALKESVANEPPDWTIVQELRDNGLTVRRIADIMGVSKSSVQKHTTKKPKG